MMVLVLFHCLFFQSCVKMWEEVTVAQTESRRELVLAGKSVAERLQKSGIGITYFTSLVFKG